jgi:hypothetical protein
MFRYRRSMKWAKSVSMPFNAGFVSGNRIPIRHYPHRDPLQMQRRYKLRAAMMKLKAHAGGHWKLDDWHKDLVNSEGVAQSAKEKIGLADNSNVDTGPLYYWAPGTPFQEMPLHNHIPPPRIRIKQRIVHPLLLPILDRLRPEYDRSYKPVDIPPDVAKHIYD